MTPQLILTLFVEGVTDVQFLSTIVQRTADDMLRKQGRHPVDVPKELDVIIRDKYHPEINAEPLKILQVAHEYAHSDVLILHFDSGPRTRHTAFEHHFKPANTLILQKRLQANLCDYLVPLIPIRETEAWMLADFRALQTALNTTLSAKDLGLPSISKRVESVTDPKKVLEQALAIVNKSRTHPNKIKIESLYASLAKNIDLNLLGQVPAYQQFCDDLAQTLRSLHFLI